MAVPPGISGLPPLDVAANSSSTSSAYPSRPTPTLTLYTPRNQRYTCAGGAMQRHGYASFLAYMAVRLHARDDTRCFSCKGKEQHAGMHHCP